MEITKKQIDEINGKLHDGWNEGIFTEPWGIDCKEKRQVIYQRVKTGGASGGSCWGTYPEPYTNSEASEKLANWEALDEVLNLFAPNISYLQYRRVMSNLVKSNEKTQYEYYGNYDDYYIRWIVVDDLLEFLETNNIK